MVNIRDSAEFATTSHFGMPAKPNDLQLNVVYRNPGQRPTHVLSYQQAQLLLDREPRLESLLAILGTNRFSSLAFYYGVKRETKLPECRYTIIESNLFDDSAVVEPQYGDTREMYLLTGRCRQGARQEVTKGRSCMRAATLPLSNHMVSVGQQRCRSQEAQVWKCLTKTMHKCLDIFATVPRSMQRIPQEHFRGSKFIDDGRVVGLTPKLREPPSDHCLVFRLQICACLSISGESS